jgi:arylformamidase
MTLNTPSTEWFEREYNPRTTVTNTLEIITAWPPRAAATRARRAHEADVKTGDNPRELVDIFRAANPKGTIVFIHGGYWRALSKNESSWVADGFVDQGYTVVLINYPLCPEVSLASLIASVRQSFARVIRDMLSPAEKAKVLVTGHSAGGYLTCAMLSTDWTAYGLPAQPFHAALPVSGVFELSPLLTTTMNSDIRLDAASAEALNLMIAEAKVKVPVLFAVGGDESDEFHRQSRDMADHWQHLSPSLLDIAGTNHFTIIEEYADPHSELTRAALGLLQS